MEDVFASLREIEWDDYIPPEDIIAECTKRWYNNGEFEIEGYTNAPEGFTPGRLPGQKRSTWKTKRYWWNNGKDEALLPNCPDGWKRGRMMSEEHKDKFKCKPGRQKGVSKNTNRKRDSKGRLLPGVAVEKLSPTP